VGAGFSAPLGYPVGRGLIADLVEYLQGKTTRLRGRMPKAYFKNYESSLSKADLSGPAKDILDSVIDFAGRYLAPEPHSLADVDVAEFFSVAQALAEQTLLVPIGGGAKSSPRPAGQQRDFSRIYADLAIVLRSYFHDIAHAVGNKLPGDIAAVLNGLDCSRDAIVNFNWDEEVDYFLSKPSKDTDIAYTATSWTKPNDFLVLKPHGSIGWYDVAQGLGNSGYYLVADHSDERIARDEKRLISLWDIELPREIRTNQKLPLSCPPIITAPTFGKRFPFPEQRLIWSDVIDVCRHAEEFVFLGYRLPKDDFLTRAAIRCSQAESRQRNQSGGSVRYIAVLKLDADDALPSEQETSFKEVFGTADTRNFLNHTFGDFSPTKPKQSLIRTIEQQLAG
jgi:hypothetical protein